MLLCQCAPCSARPAHHVHYVLRVLLVHVPLCYPKFDNNRCCLNPGVNEKYIELS